MIVLLFCIVFHRFFSSNITKQTAIATIMAPVEPMRYSPVGSCGGGGVGVGEAAGASSTFMYVCANELPYALDPSKVAMIVYMPGTSGVNGMAN